ncbi:uncharacterized protein LOC100118678 [Nasonia vitripennis]|uniref:Disintegrin and metalloproteinase domain-containing protein 19 n=1 Tax=Nasonia vitripennis TaxID=7425 RepID=A0A7M7QGA5_NASVI|nr:uncharacterized protein LOC100118678 [Nasonia vitripennis]
MMAERMRRLLTVVVLLLLSVVVASNARIQGPSADFSAHRIVRPRVYHGRSKREITSTRESDTDHTDVLSVGLELNGESRILDLRLNTDLIPAGYKERYQHQGSYKTNLPSKVELCHYQGSIRDMPGSWAAVSTCRGLKGVIFDGESLHHIQPEEETLQSAHYLYKHSDLVANNTCGYKGTPHHIAEEFAAAHKASSGRTSRHKRAASEVRGPYNANRQSRYVELVLVIDKHEYTALGENLTRVHHHCKDIVNIINALYTPLNIFIALIGVEVWTDADEIHLQSNGDTTLNNFLTYRRERLVKTIPNDNAQLLTKMQFDEGVVGKALKGPICTYEFSGGVSVDHSNVVGLVAATVAHEMGHNFGMEHDSSDCICPEERCIMAPSSGSSGPTHWSSCSLEYLALAFEHGMDYCLRNKPKQLFDSPICGNGFVEPGEQCDCGLTMNCDNPCCDALTCMLHANASCATGKCCDLQTCKPKQAGTECRSADQECDLPEYCTGQSEYCPSDVFKIDGETCSMGKAYCYQGSCRTHNDQCKLLWGPTGSSSDTLCYEMNNKGTKNGNCGYNRTGNNYIKCHEQNILCGMLHCKHLNERLEFGMESVATLSHSFINSEGNIIACRSAIVDLGLNQVDPGLAPDGAKCASGKMCVNQKCMAVADLRASFPGGKACPNNCSGNGVCNSLGHCHCNRGFQPPDCTIPGVGGSQDSGPAEDPNARSEYIMSLYIIFLGIVPTIGLISFGIWYTRNNGGAVKQWKKASSSGAMSTLTRGFGFDHHHHHHQPPHSGSQARSIVSNGGIKIIERSGPLGIDSIDGGVPQDPACASLLPKTDPDERFNNNFFGQFKGFSISPLKNTNEASAPPPPAQVSAPPPAAGWNVNSVATTVPIKTNLKPIQRSSTLRQTPSIEAPSAELLSKPVVPPALPPPNAGSTARPLISSPVLAATTCTSVELVGPKMPTRPAPSIPVKAQQPEPEKQPSRPPSTSLDLEPREEKRRGSAEKSIGSSSTLTRIASMLYPMGGKSNDAPVPQRYHTNSLPRSQHHKASKVLDKEILRSLEISAPIPQKEIEIPTATIPVKPDASSPTDSEKQRNVVMRAQSMRDSKVTPRPTIHTFGSMRQSNPNKRPTSIPASVRPTSPPPGPPVKPAEAPADAKKIPGLPGYQSPAVLKAVQPTDNAYDDCMNLVSDANLGKIVEESPSSDNIYAVIEESLPEKLKPKRPAPPVTLVDSEYKTPKSVDLAAGQDKTDSMGLLSEIVSEISSRNFDSIYSTKTLSPEHPKTPETYVNASHYKSPSSLYSNSTTSSGYLHPSALNVPKPEEPAKISSTASSPVPSKPSSVTAKTLDSKKKEEPKETKPATKPGFNRTKTPPGLTKLQKPARQGSDASSNKPASRQNSDSSLKGAKSDNSPDLVSSCSANANKSPDVLGRDNANKAKPAAAKSVAQTRQKNVSMPPKPSNLLTKAANFSDKSKTTAAAKTTKSPTSPSKAETKTPGSGLQKAAGSKSNVASLQQKFEQSEKGATNTLTRKKPGAAKTAATTTTTTSRDS